MRIIYLTTALDPQDYETLLATKGKAPNPSNQNFHSKLIAYFKMFHNVKVIARRYHSSRLFEKRKSTNEYFYPAYINIPIIKNISVVLNSIQHAADFSPQYIVVDVLNVTLMELAVRIKKQTNAQIIGVITDNPLNLSNVNKRYTEHVFKRALKCDAFIGLTNSLLKLFNTKNKPILTVPGFVPLNEAIKNTHEGQYAFFGGALYSRYGVDVLVETFKNDVPLKLKIAGHGPLRKEIKKTEHNNIDFVGLITPPQTLAYSQNATININPRPFDSALDEYSIPSKLIDYIFTGVPTISTKNSALEQIVGNNVFWIGEVTVYCLSNAIKTLTEDYNAWLERALNAKRLLIEALGPNTFNEQFVNFTKQIKN